MTTNSQATDPQHQRKSRGAETARQAVPRLLLSDEETAAALNVGMTTFHELRRQPWFPPPIQLGPRLLRWSLTEIEHAIGSMPRQQAAAEPTQLLRGKIAKLKGEGLTGGTT